MKRNTILPFLAGEALLYAAFLTEDLLGISAGNIALKYAAVLLCLAFAGWCALRGGDRLVFPALLLTALADLFLLVLGRHLAAGVLLFLGVQSVYLIRLRMASGRTWLLPRVAIPLLIGVAMYTLGLASPLNLLAGLYFSQLVTNTALAWTVPGKRWRLFALGLTLFVGCDVCVGLFNVPTLIPALYPFARVGMWLFYLPSQLLISLSALPEKGVSHETL